MLFTLNYFWADVLVIFLAKYLPYVLVALFVVFFISNFIKRFKPTVLAVVSAGFGVIITSIIRFFVYRPRPFIELSMTPLVQHSAGSSFPSMHAVFFFAIATAVVLYNKKAGVWFFAGSCLVVIARVLAGLHWPSDVLVGAVLGILLVLLTNWLWCRGRESNPHALASSGF